MLNLKKTVMVGVALAALTSASYARNIYGYVAFRNGIAPIVGCRVHLLTPSGDFIRETRTYSHVFGVFRARYHFNGNINHTNYKIRVIPDALYGTVTTANFRPAWAFWSDTKAPDVRVW
jgi:hypothetical protein